MVSPQELHLHRRLSKGGKRLIFCLMINHSFESPNLYSHSYFCSKQGQIHPSSELAFGSGPDIC